MEITALTPLFVLIFGLIVILYEIQTKTRGWGINTTNIVVVTLVITAVMFISTIMPDQDKYLNGIIALLGSIVGYIFGQGKYDPKKGDEEKEAKESTEVPTNERN